MNILSEQCATCIFRPGNPMFLDEGRVRRMVETCKRRDIHIPCHEHMHIDPDAEADEDGATQINLEDPVCRGFFDAYPGVGQMIRISARLEMLHFVDGNGNRVEGTDELRDM